VKNIKLLNSISIKIKDSFSIDLRSLAVYRIAISLCLISDLISRFNYIDLFQTENGFINHELRIGISEYLPHHWNYSFEFHISLFLLATVFAIMLLLGWYTKIATFFFMVIFSFITF